VVDEGAEENLEWVVFTKLVDEGVEENLKWGVIIKLVGEVREEIRNMVVIYNAREILYLVDEVIKRFT